MRYSICIIDDEIPATGIDEIRDSDLLNSSNLQFLLKQEEKPWTDEIVKNLVKTLLDEKNGDGTPKWDVYGFTNPAFYINIINDGIFRSDILVFDWDYPGSGSETNSENLLKEILDKTFSLVFIFSKADKETEIKAIMEKPEFQGYKERLFYLDKATSGTDQTSTLLRTAEDKYTNNFSFRFASVLRKKAVQTMDKILSDMGRASLNDVKIHVIVGDGGKKDFIDFLAERFRTAIAGKDIYDLVEQIPKPNAGAPIVDESVATKVWSSRLYFHPETGDNLVRRGDIVKIDESYRFVLSADCDLNRFWKKNLGIINTIMLHELKKTNTTLRDLLTLCSKPSVLTERKLNNILDKIGNLAEGPFILPFVPVNNDTKNFVAIPKEMLSERVGIPSHLATPEKKQDAGEEPIRYSYWHGAVRVCTISEPFLTPVIQHVLKVMGGNGVPDYPEHMKKILEEILKDFKTIETPTI
jgi:hypothetical protein